jgi:hypothetical protein
MNSKDWQPIFERNNFEADLPAGWFKVVDYVKTGKILKFEASGEWTFLPGLTCEPDGYIGFPLPYDKLLVSTTPVGALIGKLGGSTADQKDGTLFAIGSYTIFVPPEKGSGPLYIGANTIVGAPIPRIRLSLTVSIADV